MPQILSGVVTIPEELVRSAYVTPWQVFVMKTAELVRGVETYAQEHGLKYRRQDFVLTGGSLGFGSSPIAFLKLEVEAHQIHVTEVDVLDRRWFAVPDDLVGGWACATTNRPLSEIDIPGTDHRVPIECWGRATAEHVTYLHNAWLQRRASGADQRAAEVDAAFSVLCEEFELPAAANIRGVFPYGMPEGPGPEREAALAKLREADQRAEANVKAIIGRALEAAALARPAPAIELSTPSEVTEVTGIDQAALDRLNALPDFELTLEGRFWDPNEGRA